MVSYEEDSTDSPTGDAPGGEVFRLSERDLREAAALHVEELPEEFVSRFGVRFIEGYYRAFIEGEDAIALGVRDPHNERLLGVMIGAPDARTHYSYLVRKHGPGLALNAVRAAVKNPSLAADLVRTRLLRYASGLLRTTVSGRGEEPRKASEEDHNRVGFAVYVAVRSGERRSGSGRKLFRVFEAFCRESGSYRIEVATRPDSAGEKFFTALGWNREEERVTRSDERYVIFQKLLR